VLTPSPPKKGTHIAPELTHPIFIDQIGRKSLEVKLLSPVKIRKCLRWQFLKALNRFGNLSSLIAGSVFLASAVDNTFPYNPVSIIFWILFGVIAAWAAWSALTSTTYRISSESD
jgi:hypothetical protein